jgi:hypothetical protein
LNLIPFLYAIQLMHKVAYGNMAVAMLKCALPANSQSIRVEVGDQDIAAIFYYPAPVKQGIIHVFNMRIGKVDTIISKLSVGILGIQIVNYQMGFSLREF